MAGLIRKLLEALGFSDIRAASDGPTALAALTERAYGLVLSELYMEPMDGLALLKAIRSAQLLRTVPFIMVTASAQTENVAEAKKLGANGYILKPFNTNTLRRSLANVLGDF